MSVIREWLCRTVRDKFPPDFRPWAEFYVADLVNLQIVLADTSFRAVKSAGSNYFLLALYVGSDSF